MIKIEIIDLRHAYPEAPPFKIHRPSGTDNYTFLHFFYPVVITLNGKQIKTKPNAVLIYPPFMPQFFSSNIKVVHDWAHVSSDTYKLLEKYQIKTGEVFYPKNPALITQMFRELEGELLSKRGNREKLISLLFEEFLIKLSRDSAEESAPIIEPSEQFFKLRNRMFLELSTPWTIEELSKLVNLSPSRFQVVYKNIFGISPIDDLIKARIAAAKNILSTDKSSVSEISRRLGYNNVFHFIRQFKKQTGLSPTEYRKIENGR